MEDRGARSGGVTPTHDQTCMHLTYGLASERRVKIKAEANRTSWEDETTGMQTWKYYYAVINWYNVPGMFKSLLILFGPQSFFVYFLSYVGFFICDLV